MTNHEKCTGYDELINQMRIQTALQGEIVNALKERHNDAVRANNEAADETEGWLERAQSGKRTESLPFRFNPSQQLILRYAAEDQGRSMSSIIAELVWPALEARYGKYFK